MSEQILSLISNVYMLQPHIHCISIWTETEPKIYIFWRTKNRKNWKILIFPTFCLLNFILENEILLQMVYFLIFSHKFNNIRKVYVCIECSWCALQYSPKSFLVVQLFLAWGTSTCVRGRRHLWGYPTPLPSPLQHCYHYWESAPQLHCWCGLWETEIDLYELEYK